MSFLCCRSERRETVARSSKNGIDFLEVLDGEEGARTLLAVHLLKELPKNTRTSPGDSVLDLIDGIIEGGERIKDVIVKQMRRDADLRVVQVQLNHAGDLSPYTLRLMKRTMESSREGHLEPPDGFDPVLSCIDFSFKEGCPSSQIDCRSGAVCSRESAGELDIDYLAKDYASLRKLILDRMSLLMPRWKVGNPADIGVALAELLAYMGDHLSYQQDSVATEAYMGTARRRISVRRHARLVDYFMHDGCNARTCVQIKVAEDIPKTDSGDPALPEHTKLLTLVEGEMPRISCEADPLICDRAMAVFETMSDLENLYAGHNEMHFYTWGARDCCLPKGATSAWLDGGFPHLKKGDLLIFEEVLGPKSGDAADADPCHRHVVRLKEVRATEDPIGGMFGPEEREEPASVTEIVWDDDDALPFPLCISSLSDEMHGKRQLTGVSVAMGNVVLADHGLTVRSGVDGHLAAAPTSEELEIRRKELNLSENELEFIGSVPEPTMLSRSAEEGDRCQREAQNAVRPRFSPALKRQPLTQVSRSYTDRKTGKRLAIDPTASAREALCSRAHDALPAVCVLDSEGHEWRAVRDLLNSDGTAQEFVAETDEEGSASLRFGDGNFGSSPRTGADFFAAYRIGNGAAGNVGSDCLVHIVSDNKNIESVRNPLPARGGAEPESMEEVRQRAPAALQRQERAVTVQDYADIAGRHPQIQRAAATLRWTGSWHTVFLTVDRAGGRAVDDDFSGEVSGFLEKFRMAGHDLEVEGPQYVSLEITMRVCLEDDYLPWDVRDALQGKFSNRTLPDGSRGIFHPDNLSFGERVYLSRLYETARSVEGVRTVNIIQFRRQGQDGDGLDKGYLEFDRLEIARLNNDPNYPEQGQIHILIGEEK